MIRTKTAAIERISQGDIIRDVEYIERVIEHDGVLEISKIVFPFVIVLTQDCDLEQDHTFRTMGKSTQDKWLISVLVAPLYNALHVFNGEHLSSVGIASQKINRKKTEGHLLQRNQSPRYHFLEFPQEVPVVSSVIDFKHYFSVPVPYLVEQKVSGFVCSVSELYREDISHRFSAFLSRIGLPEMFDSNQFENEF